MSNNESTQIKDLKQLPGHLGDLLKVLGGAVGASGLGVTIVYAMGFVVVNTSLLRYGAYELSLLRAEFLAAGISYLVLALGMILLGAVAVDWLAKRVGGLLEWKPVKGLLKALKVSHRTISLLVVFLGAAVLLLGVNYIAGCFPDVVQSHPELLEGQLYLNKAARLFLVGVQWWNRFDRAVVWGYMVTLIGGIYVEYLDRESFWRKLTAPGIEISEIGEIGKPILWGIALLLVALVSYGGYAYPHLPKSWGGGSPIYVEFVVNEEEAKAILETLGLKVSDKGLTERVTFLTECPERIFVVTQRWDTLSFDPSLVKASKFYDVNYYLSAEVHLSDGHWYREQRQWSRAISEYDAALLIQADRLDARIGRGIAHTEKYLESTRKESPDLQAYRDAHKDLTDAMRQAEKEKDDKRTARAYYQRGRLRFHHGAHQEATDDVAKAIGLDSSLLREAMLEEAFGKKILEDQTFRKDMYKMEDSELAEEYGALGHTLEVDKPEKAAYVYDMAAQIAQKAIDLPNRMERSAYFHSLRAQVLESLFRNEEALEEWGQALEADGDNWMYYYQFALLSYTRGLLDEVEAKCETVITRQENDKATIGCRILRGNLRRDEEDFDKAIEDYDWAAKEAVEQGFPSYAALAYYHRARLETRSGNTEQAILFLEKAVWLDGACSEKAELQGDFDILRESAGYQKAMAPPIVMEIGSDTEKRTVNFRLQEPADDFPERVTVLTQILPLADLITPDGTGQAESFEVSEDQLLYTFQLRQDASYSASDLAIGLRELLGLAGEPLTQESSATD